MVQNTQDIQELVEHLLKKIEMQDLNQCETEGGKWIRTKLPKGENQTILAYHCLVGK